MTGADRDRQVRLAAFEFVRRLTELHGDVLPIGPLRQGFVYEAARVPLMEPQETAVSAARRRPSLGVHSDKSSGRHPRSYESLGPGDEYASAPSS